MAEREPVEAGLTQVQEYYQRTAEEVRREQEALRALHRLLIELSEQSLALHRRSTQVLDSINRDLRKVKAQLKRISVART